MEVRVPRCESPRLANRLPVPPPLKYIRQNPNTIGN